MTQKIDRDSKRRSQKRSIVVYLHFKPERLAAFFGYRRAEDPAAVFYHEIDYFRCDFFCCDDEIAFILAVLVINHDNDLAVSELLYRSFDILFYDFGINTHLRSPYTILIRGIKILLGADSYTNSATLSSFNATFCHFSTPQQTFLRQQHLRGM